MMTKGDATVATASERTVYTDGAYSSKTLLGGWAWVCLSESSCGCGTAKPTTNQRMEVTAAYEALLANDLPLLVVSDSRYVVDCFLKKWYVKWNRNGWINSSKEPVANRDLWEPFIDLVLTRKNVNFEWVKGHSGDVGNEKADRLASWAVKY